MIIFKHILKNTLENKMRLFLIICSFMICTALVFVTMAVSKTIVNINIGKMKSSVGTADLVIKPKEDSDIQFFENKSLPTIDDDFEYRIGIVQSPAFYINSKDEVVDVMLQGVVLDELNKNNPIYFKEKSIENALDGNDIIISEQFAEKNNLSLGNEVSIEINRQSNNFKVVDIAKPIGLFSSNL